MITTATVPVGIAKVTAIVPAPTIATCRQTVPKLVVSAAVVPVVLLPVLPPARPVTITTPTVPVGIVKVTATRAAPTTVTCRQTAPKLAGSAEVPESWRQHARTIRVMLVSATAGIILASAVTIMAL